MHCETRPRSDSRSSGKDDLNGVDRVEIQTMHPPGCGAREDGRWEQSLQGSEAFPGIWQQPRPAIQAARHSSPGLATKRVPRDAGGASLLQRERPKLQLKGNERWRRHWSSVTLMPTVAYPGC